MSVRARIGLPGQLIEIPGTSALAQSAERASSRRVTLGGRLVTQEAAREHRTWEVTLRQGSRPQDVANLAALAAGEWGRGPFVFASEWAQVTNLLTPRASALEVGALPDNWMVGGSILLGDGSWAGRHLICPSGPTDGLSLPRVDGVTERVPAMPASHMWGTVYTNGGVYMRLRFRNAAGTLLGSSPETFIARTVDVRQAQITHVPTYVSAAWCEMLLRAPASGDSQPPLDGALIVARPAIGWGTLPPAAWYPGQGVNTAVLEGLSTEVVTAWAGPGGQRAGYSFNVVEVN